MNKDYQVFISHAGKDKFTIAIPLSESLANRSISAFVDKKGLLCGDDAPAEMEYVMETAPLGLFILSPEFLARKWPMKELLCFQRRVEEAMRRKDDPPTLIPVFYRMTVAQCGSRDIFKAKNAQGDNVFIESDFYERVDKGETSRPKVLAAVSKLSKHTGIENEEGATNADITTMFQKRTHLVERIANEVQHALNRRSSHELGSAYQGNSQGASNTHGDVFCPCYLIPPMLTNDICDFKTRDKEGKCVTAEGRFKDELMATLSRNDNSSAAAVGKISSRAPGALGMGGVGKTTAMIGVAWEGDIREVFKDGIYLLCGGQNADQASIISELVRVVDGCGGEKTAARIRAATSLKHGVDMASAWFDKKRVLLLLDDLWETEESSIGFFNELRRLVSSAGRIAVTTRNKDIAQAAGCPVYFDAFEPQVVESRNMLLKYAGIHINSYHSSRCDCHKDVEDILERCAGLPLALGIAGSAIRCCMEEGVVWKDALRVYASSLGEGEDVELLGPLGDYPGLRRMVNSSLETADRWVKGEGLLAPSGMVRPPSELYERLSVLRKQARVSVGVLSKLWGMTSVRRTRGIANKLSKLSLLSKESGLYRVHDLLMDVCISKATTNNTTNHRLSSYHESFLQAFSYPTANANTRAWWIDGNDCDGYIRENIAWHLIGSRHVEELLALLIDARWTAFRIKGENYLSWENDFSELFLEMDHLPQRHVSTSEGDMQGRRQGLALVRDAVGQAWHRLLPNPSELAFQMIGRLQGYCKNLAVVGAFLDSVKSFAERPWLRPKQKCLSSPEDALQLTLQFNESVRGLAANYSLRRAFVGVGPNILVVDLRLRKVIGKMQGHAADVISLAISADKRRIVSGSLDRTLRVWDGDSMCQVGEPLEGHSGPVWSVAISQDGKRVVSGSGDTTLRVWDVDRMCQMGEPLEGHKGEVWCVAMSQDGARIVSGSEDRTLRVWEADRMYQVGEPLKDHLGEVWCVAMSQDGKRIVFGSEETLHVLDGDSMCQVGPPLEGHKETVKCVAISQDGKRIVSGSMDKTLCVWDVDGMCQMGEPLEGHCGWAEFVAICGDGKHIVSGSRDKTLRMWNAECMRPIGEPLKVHAATVKCVTISKDGEQIVSGSMDKTLRVWDAKCMHQLGDALRGHSGPVWCVAMFPKGKQVVSGSADETLRVWDLERMRQVGVQLEGHTGPVWCVVVSQDGKRIVSGSLDCTLRLWDAERMCPVGEPLKGHAGPVDCVAISPDGKQIVSGSWDQTLCIWDVENMRQVGECATLDGFEHKMQFLGGDMVTCTTEKESAQFRVDGAMGLVRVDDFMNGEVSSRETKLRCVGTEVWIHVPRKSLLGTLEEIIDGMWMYDQHSNTLVTGHESGRLFGFELIE